MNGLSLAAVASWDVPLLRGAITALDTADGRLPLWRARVDEVRRSLGTVGCWSGPAADAAAGAVTALSDTTSEVAVAIGRSREALDRLVAAAAAAQAGAAEALAAAAAAGVTLDAAGRLQERVGPTLTMAPDQLAAVAARAAAAGHAADLAAGALAAAATAEAAGGEALAALPAGLPDSPPDPGFFPEQLRSGPAVPAGLSAQEISAWWTALPAAGQERLIAAAPAVVGALDGAPAWARDRANRILLDRALQQPGEPRGATARAVAGALGDAAAAGEQVQLWSFDAQAGRAALALGDLDTADAVGLLVPGIFTTVDDDLRGQLGNARDVAAAARAAAPGLAVATVAWLGYRTPQGPVAAIDRRDSRAGGAALDHALDGLAASRAANGRPHPRTTVLAHSYGTVVVDAAAGEDGRLAADAVVLLGSPGMSRTADALEAPEVYDAATPADPISLIPWFGTRPWEPAYGAVELPVDPLQWHTAYYDRDHPTLAAMGEVVAGVEGHR